MLKKIFASLVMIGLVCGMGTTMVGCSKDKKAETKKEESTKKAEETKKGS